MDALSGLVAIATTIAVGLGVLATQRRLALGRTRAIAEFRHLARDLASRQGQVRSWASEAGGGEVAVALRLAMSARRIAEADPEDPDALSELVAAESALSRALRPHVPADGPERRELAAIEARLAPSAHVLRKACAAHDHALRGFPGAVVGRLFGYRPLALPEFEWALRRDDPGVP